MAPQPCICTLIKTRMYVLAQAISGAMRGVTTALDASAPATAQHAPDQAPAQALLKNSSAAWPVAGSNVRYVYSWAVVMAATSSTLSCVLLLLVLLALALGRRRRGRAGQRQLPGSGSRRQQRPAGAAAAAKGAPMMGKPSKDVPDRPRCVHGVPQPLETVKTLHEE